MKDQISEAYQGSVKALRAMVENDQKLATAPVLSEGLVSVLGDILESEQLFIENPDSDSALVLTASTNKPVFEAVACSAVSILEGEDEKDEDEDEEDDEDEDEDNHEEKESDEDEKAEHCNEATDGSEAYVGDVNDTGTADDDSGEGSDATPSDESEEIDADEVEDIKESLKDLITSDKYLVKTHLDGNGWLITKSSPKFEAIQNALVDQLIAISEAFECQAEATAFLEGIATLNKAGMGVVLVEADYDYQSRTAGAATGPGTEIRKAEIATKANHRRMDRSKLKTNTTKVKAWLRQGGKAGRFVAKHPKKLAAGAAALTAGAAFAKHKLAKKSVKESLQEGKRFDAFKKTVSSGASKVKAGAKSAFNKDITIKGKKIPVGRIGASALTTAGLSAGVIAAKKKLAKKGKK